MRSRSARPRADGRVQSYAIDDVAYDEFEKQRAEQSPVGIEGPAREITETDQNCHTDSAQQNPDLDLAAAASLHGGTGIGGTRQHHRKKIAGPHQMNSSNGRGHKTRRNVHSGQAGKEESQAGDQKINKHDENPGDEIFGLDDRG